MILVLALAACCSPLSMYLLISRYYPGDRKPATFALIIGLAMAGLAFGLYNTSIYSDLTRYMEQAMLTQGLTLQQAFDMFKKSHISDTPLAIVWFWLVGQTGNAQVYPATIAFVEYSILAYVLADIAIKEKISRVKFAFMLLFLIIATPIFDSVSSVRSTPALAVGAFAIYLEYYKKEHVFFAVLLYLCAPLIHSVGFVTILVRVLCAVAERSMLVAVIVGLALLPTIFVLSDLLNPIFSSFGFSVAARLKNYVNSDESSYATMVASNRFLIARKWVTLILLTVSLVLVARKYKTNIRTVTPELRGMIVIGAIFAAISISFALIVTVPSYARFTYIAVPFLGMALLRHASITSSKEGVYRGWNPKISLLLYFLCFCPYVFIMFVNMSHRVDLQGFAMHLLFGFIGASLV